jgi:peptide/nickel transport system ATP-binding protein
MYAGEIVEQGTLSQIVRSPIHPYARGLLASTVHGAERGQRLETIPGTPPSLDRAPTSCSFRAALRFRGSPLRRAAAAQRAGRAKPDRKVHPGGTCRDSEPA